MSTAFSTKPSLVGHQTNLQKLINNNNRNNKNENISENNNNNYIFSI